MEPTRATFTTAQGEPSPVPTPSPPAPPRPPVAAGRFHFMGSCRSWYTFKSLAMAVASSIGSLAQSMPPPSPSTEAMKRFLADIRMDARRSSKRGSRELAHALIMERGRCERMTPPVVPSWLIQRAPWAQYMGFIRPRGRRRMRAWI